VKTKPMAFHVSLNRLLSGAAVGISLIALLVVPLAQAEVSGTVGGLVRDEHGVPRMGAVIALLTPEGRPIKRVFSDYRGIFKVENLFPGDYSIRVTLDRFLPLLKQHIRIESGRKTILDVNLRGVFASLQMLFPDGGEIRDMSDDWKWVLKTASTSRPVLRFLPAENRREMHTVMRKVAGNFSDTRGYAQVSAGGGARQSGLANETDLGTAFAVATSLLGNNDLTFSGNLGYGASTGSPSAAFQTSFSRQVGGMAPEVSITVRQLQAPAMAGRSIFGSGPDQNRAVLQTLTLGFGDTVQLGETVRFEYGFLYESVSFINRLDFVSPYGRLIYNLGSGREIQLRYASGVPQTSDSGTGGEALRQQVSTLGLFPRVSLHDGRAAVQRTEHMEIAYREKIGEKGMLEVAAYQDSLSDAAVTALVPGGHFADGNILPDLFSNSSTLNAGLHRSKGYRISYARELRDHLQAAIGYGLTGALSPTSSGLVTPSVEELRSSLHMRPAHMVSASISSKISRSGTRIISSYQWLNQQAVIATDLYNDFAARSDPGLNIVIRQPLPFGGSLPGKLEATADFRNLLKAGYVPIQTYDGQQMYLLQAIRSYRGALSFVF
jgi:hypothetical protein